MVKEEMTIHEALREVKMLDKRIASAIRDFEGGIKAVAYQESKIGSLAISDWETRQRASYDSINDLITRRSAIKQKISESNAKTTVVIEAISPNPITVAAAIDMQKYGLKYQEDLLENMREAYRVQSALMNRKNAEVEFSAISYANGLSNSKDVTQSTVKQIDEIREQYYQNNKWILRDPLNLLTKIEELEKKIEDTKAKIDSRLSVINATTVITVEY